MGAGATGAPAPVSQKTKGMGGEVGPNGDTGAVQAIGNVVITGTSSRRFSRPIGNKRRYRVGPLPLGKPPATSGMGAEAGGTDKETAPNNIRGKGENSTIAKGAAPLAATGNGVEAEAPSKLQQGNGRAQDPSGRRVRTSRAGTPPKRPVS
ncbi:hypothetical protein Emed_002258 [Eimeria media]